MGLYTGRSVARLARFLPRRLHGLPMSFPCASHELPMSFPCSRNEHPQQRLLVAADSQLPSHLIVRCEETRGPLPSGRKVCWRENIPVSTQLLVIIRQATPPDMSIHKTPRSRPPKNPNFTLTYFLVGGVSAFYELICRVVFGPSNSLFHFA